MSTTVGGVEGEVSGHLRVLGSDQHSLSVIAFPGLPPTETEDITVDGVRYQRVPNGIWMQSQVGGSDAAPTDPVKAAMSRVDDLEVVGTEESGGVTLHRLESDGLFDVGPEALGITDPSVTDFEANFAFLAEADGTPAAILFSASWTQGAAEAPIAAAFEMRFDMTIGAAVTIEAPADPWTVYTSAELGYSMAHPVDWDVTHVPASDGKEAGDQFFGPVDGQVQVYRYDGIPADVTPNLYFRGIAEGLADHFGSQPALVEELTLPNGLEVQVFNLEVVPDSRLYFFQDAAMYRNPVGWEVIWYSSPGYETDALARLMNFVTSFEPTP